MNEHSSRHRRYFVHSGGLCHHYVANSGSDSRSEACSLRRGWLSHNLLQSKWGLYSYVVSMSLFKFLLHHIFEHLKILEHVVGKGEIECLGSFCAEGGPILSLRRAFPNSGRGTSRIPSPLDIPSEDWRLVKSGLTGGGQRSSDIQCPLLELTVTRRWKLVKVAALYF
jgi:hypothetical protein